LLAAGDLDSGTKLLDQVVSRARRLTEGPLVVSVREIVSDSLALGLRLERNQAFRLAQVKNA